MVSKGKTIGLRNMALKLPNFPTTLNSPPSAKRKRKYAR